MKFKTTKKEITDNYGIVVKVPFCRMAHVAQYQEPVAYTCGQYGWNADIYQKGGVAFVTGYRPFGTSFDEIVKKYDNAANRAMNDIKDYTEKYDFINSLFAQMWRDIIAEANKD